METGWHSSSYQGAEPSSCQCGFSGKWAPEAMLPWVQLSSSGWRVCLQGPWCPLRRGDSCSTGAKLAVPTLGQIQTALSPSNKGFKNKQHIEIWRPERIKEGKEKKSVWTMFLFFAKSPWNCFELRTQQILSTVYNMLLEFCLEKIKIKSIRKTCLLLAGFCPR